MSQDEKNNRFDFNHVTEGEYFSGQRTTIEFDHRQENTFLFSLAFAIKVLHGGHGGQVVSRRKISFDNFVGCNEICQMIAKVHTF
jgi:hypothetical protein